MVGMISPSFTQWRVRIVRDGADVGDAVYVNFFDELGTAVSGAIDAAVGLEADDVVVEGRRRLNDFVGSPVWGEWIRVQA
jgi:hypothetical protein